MTLCRQPSLFSGFVVFCRLSRNRHSDQLSEPYTKSQSKSLRDVFERAILRGDVAIISPGLILFLANRLRGHCSLKSSSSLLRPILIKCKENLR